MFIYVTSVLTFILKMRAASYLHYNCYDPRDYNLNDRLDETLRTNVCNTTTQSHVKQKYRN